MTWVDFAQVKSTVSLQRVLQDYGIWEKLRRSGRDHYRGRCPIHGGEGQDAFHGDLGKTCFIVFPVERAAMCWTWSHTWSNALYEKPRSSYSGGIWRRPVELPRAQCAPGEINWLQKKERGIRLSGFVCRAWMRPIPMWAPVA